MNPIAWVEIPTKDLDRAMNFYTQVFGWDLKIDVDGPTKMSFLPFNPNVGNSSGALVKMGKFYKPATVAGPLVYLSCADILATEKRIVDAGGEIKINKTQISPEHGSMAVFIDSEGNRMALYSNP